eukprot:12915935-Prorocentrum_lima.AAC.1
MSVSHAVCDPLPERPHCTSVINVIRDPSAAIQECTPMLTGMANEDNPGGVVFLVTGTRVQSRTGV